MLATETQYPGSTRQQFSDSSHMRSGLGRAEVLVLGRAAPFTCPPSSSQYLASQHKHHSPHGAARREIMQSLSSTFQCYARYLTAVLLSHSIKQFVQYIVVEIIISKYFHQIQIIFPFPTVGVSGQNCLSFSASLAKIVSSSPASSNLSAQDLHK